MRLARFFIDRPVFAAVLSIAITLVGGIAAWRLPVSEYPDIAPPTVQVTALYPGASAETIAQTVAGPVEQEVNGVDGMLYLSSQSTGDGRVTISVVFRQGTDVDQAQVLVQNRVAIAEPRLPEDVRRLGITVKKASPDLLMVVHMTSPDGSRSPEYVSNFATLAIKDRLTRIDGVGDAQVLAPATTPCGSGSTPTALPPAAWRRARWCRRCSGPMPRWRPAPSARRRAPRRQAPSRSACRRWAG